MARNLPTFGGLTLSLLHARRLTNLRREHSFRIPMTSSSLSSAIGSRPVFAGIKSSRMLTALFSYFPSFLHHHYHYHPHIHYQHYYPHGPTQFSLYPASRSLPRRRGTSCHQWYDGRGWFNCCFVFSLLTLLRSASHLSGTSAASIVPGSTRLAMTGSTIRDTRRLRTTTENTIQDTRQRRITTADTPRRHRAPVRRWPTPLVLPMSTTDSITRGTLRRRIITGCTLLRLPTRCQPRSLVSSSPALPPLLRLRRGRKRLLARWRLDLVQRLL